MKQLTALVWKEWHEVRVLFAIALFVFLGLPIIGGIQFVIFQNGRFSIDASIWVMFLGGLLSIVVAVGTVTRDVNGKLEEFWRSRPVHVLRWLLVKYGVGLAVVLVSLIVPLLIERAFGPVANLVSSSQILAWHPFLWTALFSIAFATACICRRGAHAGMLSAAIALLIYFLPTIIPSLKFMSVTLVSYDSQYGVRGWSARDGFHSSFIGYIPWASGYAQYGPLQLAYIGGMLLLAITGLIVAVVALKRDWRIEAGRKMLYWSVGAALLLLFATAASQVGANLPVLHTAELSLGSEWMRMLQSDGQHGIMASQPVDERNRMSGTIVRTLDISQTGIAVTSTLNFANEYFGALWVANQPDVIYTLFSTDDPETTPNSYPGMSIFDLRGTGSISTIRFRELAAKNWSLYQARIIGDRLYVLGPGVMIFDIADRYQPKLLQTVPIATSIMFSYSRFFSSDGLNVLAYPLLDIPGLTPREKLQFVNVGGTSLQGDTLAQMDQNRIGAGFSVYDLKELTETTATFQRRATYEPSLMQRLFGGDLNYELQRSGDKLYGVGWSQLSGNHLVAFDVGSAVPTQIGHFAFGDKWTGVRGLQCALPNGSVLAVSEGAVMVLGAPKQR